MNLEGEYRGGIQHRYAKAHHSHTPTPRDSLKTPAPRHAGRTTDASHDPRRPSKASSRTATQRPTSQSKTGTGDHATTAPSMDGRSNASASPAPISQPAAARAPPPTPPRPRETAPTTMIRPTQPETDTPRPPRGTREREQSSLAHHGDSKEQEFQGEWGDTQESVPGDGYDIRGITSVSAH